jgi:GTP-binding protein HflX
LEDSIESVFLLHIIDASDPFIQERINVVDEILDDIGAKQHRVLVFNKIDLIDESRLKELKETYKNYDSVFISIIDEIGLEDLKDRIINLI